MAGYLEYVMLKQLMVVKGNDPRLRLIYVGRGGTIPRLSNRSYSKDDAEDKMKRLDLGLYREDPEINEIESWIIYLAEPEVNEYGEVAP